MDCCAAAGTKEKAWKLSYPQSQTIKQPLFLSAALLLLLTVLDYDLRLFQEAAKANGWNSSVYRNCWRITIRYEYDGPVLRRINQQTGRIAPLILNQVTCLVRLNGGLLNELLKNIRPLSSWTVTQRGVVRRWNTAPCRLRKPADWLWTVCR